MKNFIRKMFALKKIRSYDGLRKYFDAIFLTRGRREAGMEEFERVCCVRGYHVYNEIWEAATGEILICERELHNGRDRYAV